MDRTQQNQRQQRGISLYTLLAAVVVLGVLTSVLVTSFTGTHSKGVAAWVLVKNVAAAGKQFHLDTSCWPAHIEALWSYAASDKNSCGNATIPKSMWHGPYITKTETDSQHKMLTPQFGPQAKLKVWIQNDNQFKVSTSGMTDEMMDAITAACHGGTWSSGHYCFQHDEGGGISYVVAEF